jgi:hypothetical protein
MLVVLDQAKLPKLRVVGSIPIARCNSLKALGHKFTAPESRLCREWVRNLFDGRSRPGLICAIDRVCLRYEQVWTDL